MHPAGAGADGVGYGTAMDPSAFFPPDAQPGDRPCLVCLPFAGGGVGVYRTWPAAVPDGVDVVPIQLPGRERRLRDAPYTAMTALVRDLWPALRDRLGGPWALFGHSMGAAIAWELACAAAVDGCSPAHLFVSARRAPTLPPPHPPLFALPDDRMVAEVERLYGALPAILHRHPALLRTFLPTLRADLRLLDTWQPTDAVLACPITAYAGLDDHAVAPETVAPWAERTRGPFEAVALPGGHFLVRDRDDVRDHVAATLRGLLGGGPGDPPA